LQTTINHSLNFAGVGLHSGRPARLVLQPAAAGHGIVFRRGDVIGQDASVPALWSHVVRAALNTKVENADGVGVGTIEHLMAALAGCGVHNVLIEIDGPEVPILDGSALQFVRGLIGVGLRRLDTPLDVIQILAPVVVTHGDAVARLDPAETLEMDFTIDFADAAIGHQEKQLDLANGAFVRELCDSRTFCRQADVDAMRANGLALGGTLRNAVVVDGGAVLTPGGLRHKDEAVRHKMLDALGDLATAGAPILGRYTGVKSGHFLTNQLLRALFDRPEAWCRVPGDARIAARLPGAGLRRNDLRAVA